MYQDQSSVLEVLFLYPAAPQSASIAHMVPRFVSSSGSIPMMTPSRGTAEVPTQV